MKKIIINNSLCIGCGACVAIDPTNFEFNDEGLSIAKNENVEISNELTEAVESCPTNAIKLVEINQDNCSCEECTCEGECDCN